MFFLTPSIYKPLKKSSAIQVWGMISFLLLIYEKRNWYHWKAWLFFFTMMCHLPWLCNHGMCSTPEYRAKSEVKCCKMHCFQHRSLHFFWRCNVFWIVPRWQCMWFVLWFVLLLRKCVSTVCMRDWAFVWGETWKSWKSRMKVNSKWMINPKLVDEDTFQLS